MASGNITVQTALTTPQPTMLMYAGLSPFGATDDRKITANDLIREITANVTDVSVQWGDGVAAALSAAGKGKLIYNDTAKSFQVSENGGAYQNLLKGTGTATRVAFWSVTPDELSSDANLYWDNTNKRLSVGVGASPNQTVDILANAGEAATQWRPTTGTPRAQLLITSAEAQIGTSTAHTFHIMANGNQYISVDPVSGQVGINFPSGMQSQLHILSATNTTPALIARNASSSGVDIARFQNGGSSLFIFNDAATATFGLASSNTGTLKLAVSGSANTQSFQAGTSPAASNTYRWPNADPTLGQALTASAPAAGIVTLSWTSVGTVTGTGTPTRIAFWGTSSSLSDDAGLYWDNTNKRLSVGQGSSPTQTVDIKANTGEVNLNLIPTTGTPRVQALVTSAEGQIGTSTAHTFHLISNNTQYLSIDPVSGQVGINFASGMQSQLHIFSATNTTPALIARNNTSSGVDIARFQNGGASVFIFNDAGTATIGRASGVTGTLTLCASGSANTQSLRAGTSPAAANVFVWPNADPSAGQVLTGAAPVAGVVTLTWTTPASAATPGTPVNSVQFNQPLGTFAGDAGLLYIANSTTGNQLALASSTITSGNLFSITMTGTAATSNTKTALNVSSSGANGTNAQTVFGAQISVTNTNATSGTNIGLQVGASGATTTNTDLLIGNAAKAVTVIGSNLSGANPAYLYLGSGAFRFDPANLGNTNAIISNTNVQLGASSQLAWGTTNTITSNSATQFTVDVGLIRAAAGVLRTTNASTGIGSLLVAASTASVTGNFSVISSNAATSTVYDVARLGANSTGTPAAGFGGTFSFSLQSSTTADQAAIQEKWFWQNATHATRSAAVSWTVVNNAALTEYMNLSPAGGGGTFVGTAACLSVYAGTAPSVWTAGAFACKLYLLDAAGTPATGCAANFSTTSTASAAWMMLRGRGTNASPAVPQSGDQIGEIQYAGMNNTSTNNISYGALIRVTATETWNAGATGCDFFFHNSVTGGTVAEKMSLRNTGTLRIGAVSGSFNTTTLLQIGAYASWNTDVVGAIYTAANGTKGLEVIGTSGQTADLFRVFRDTVTPDLFKVQSVLGTVVRAGLGVNAADYAYVGGNLKTNTTGASNVSTTETDLITYSLRANSLGTNGDYCEIEAAGTFSSAVSNKRVRMYFGATVIFDTTALAFGSSSWYIYAKVIRTGATTQISVGVFDGNLTLITQNSLKATPGETLSGAVTIKCTGQGGASDEITQDWMTVQWYPNGQ